MTIFNPTEYPPDEYTILNSNSGLKINTDFNNTSNNNNIPLIFMILVFGD